MHSNVQKRTAHSSRLEVTNGGSPSSGNAHAHGNADKSTRRRRLRRKKTSAYAKSQRRFAILQATVGFILLLVVSLHAFRTIQAKRAEWRRDAAADQFNKEIANDAQAMKDRHRRENKRNRNVDPNAENVLEPEDKENGKYHSARDRVKSWGKKIKRISQYEHSDIMPNIGDKSLAYARLRKEYDELLPAEDDEDVDRMRANVEALRKRTYLNIMEGDEGMTYDVLDCPFDPPLGYPYQWNIQKVLDNWGPDDTEPRTHIYQGLCQFDFETEADKAMNYREAEVPFVVRNDPAVMRTSERWNQPGYMEKLLGDQPHRTEYSPNNHFMYWQKPKKKMRKKGLVPEDWTPPTEMMRMPFAEWLEHANAKDESLLGPDMEHWYYRLIGCGEQGDCDRGSSEYLFDELSFFQPRNDNDLYMVNPKKQKGIHCRFGMKGVIAENHFDGSRNMIALMGGERRYILAHPEQCENLSLFPRGHPSARHSAVDWSDPDWDQFPQFRDAEVNEVILQAGDVLYLPTFWFHYIISLDVNYQCNTRSGVTKDYQEHISECGF